LPEEKDSHGGRRQEVDKTGISLEGKIKTKQYKREEVRQSKTQFTLSTVKKPTV